MDNSGSRPDTYRVLVLILEVQSNGKVTDPTEIPRGFIPARKSQNSTDKQLVACGHVLKSHTSSHESNAMLKIIKLKEIKINMNNF